MTREEILKAAKPILFNTDMVRAIQNGTKTVTRRVLKEPENAHEFMGIDEDTNSAIFLCGSGLCADWGRSVKMPCKIGDILYVRETFAQVGRHIFWYKADNNPLLKDILLKPSIHMPKEAARIFLRVTDVRVERLQDISDEQAIKEGFKDFDTEPAVVGFVETWNSTIKKSDLEKYGWDTNPCVWVIEFERVFENG